MKQLTWNKSRGMTLTELLAVLMIISLLVAIAVPVYVSRQEDARVRVALADCREIANAEDLVATMHGFYVPMQILDELPADPTDMGANDEERIDLNPFDNNMYLINATVRAEDQDNIGQQFTLASGVTGNANFSILVYNLIQNWSGPYITWHRFWYNMDPTSAGYEGPTDPDYQTDNDLFRDFPLDPWGNPYRFYSPLGVIGNGNDWRGDQFNYQNPNPNFSNGVLTNNDPDRFQRYAIISYGRDGISDTDPSQPANNIYNDIYYEFGTDGLSRNFGQF